MTGPSKDVTLRLRGELYRIGWSSKTYEWTGRVVDSEIAGYVCEKSQAATAAALSAQVAGFVERWREPDILSYAGRTAVVYPAPSGWTVRYSDSRCSLTARTRENALSSARHHLAQEAAMDNWRNDTHVVEVMRWAGADDADGVARYVAFQRACEAVGVSQAPDDDADRYRTAEQRRLVAAVEELMVR